MKRVAASDAKNRFGSLLDEVSVHGCVEIVKYGRVVGVLMSQKAFEEMRQRASDLPREVWGAAHMIAPAKARAARVIRRPADFDDP